MPVTHQCRIRTKKRDDEAIGGDSASLREAAGQRSGPPGEVITRGYIDRNGEPVPASEAITFDRAVRDYADATSADKLLMENEFEPGARSAGRCDARGSTGQRSRRRRAVWIRAPGYRRRKGRFRKAESEKATVEPAEPRDGAPDGLDPELAKALQHPLVTQAIEQRIDAAEQTRQSYLNGLAVATQIAQMSFLSQFPELTGVTMENMPSAVAQMAQQDPQRYASLQALIANSEQIFARQQQESHRQAAMARESFAEFAKSEDARLDTMLKS